jgi:hypothetical protein
MTQPLKQPEVSPRAARSPSSGSVLSVTPSWIGCTVVIAAISGGCGSDERAQTAAVSDAVSDAGDPELAQRKAEFERYLRERDAIFCNPKLERVCTSVLPSLNFCDFDAVVATQCEYLPEFVATKNECGGLTLGSSGPLGGEHWHYDDKLVLIGATLSADSTQFCGQTSVTVGEICALTKETVPLCTRHDD